MTAPSHTQTAGRGPEAGHRRHGYRSQGSGWPPGQAAASHDRQCLRTASRRRRTAVGVWLPLTPKNSIALTGQRPERGILRSATFCQPHDQLSTDSAFSADFGWQARLRLSRSVTAVHVVARADRPELRPDGVADSRGCRWRSACSGSTGVARRRRSPASGWPGRTRRTTAAGPVALGARAVRRATAGRPARVRVPHPVIFPPVKPASVCGVQPEVSAVATAGASLAR